MGFEDIFVVEAFDLLGSTTVLGVLYGTTFTLYCLCAWKLYPNLLKPDNGRQARFSLGCISILYICATCFLALNARLIQLAYINHADFPGGPFAYEVSLNSTTIPYYTTIGILHLIIEFLTMAIQIRRLWIVWSATKYAVVIAILPALLLFTYIALDVPVEIVSTIVSFDQLGIPPHTAVAMTTTGFGVQSTFTLLVTGLIATRVLLARRQHARILGSSEAASPYLSIVAMLVESYALEAAWSFASAIPYGLDNPSALMLATSDPIIKIIAYFLVVYRVETGRGWTQQTERQLTSLQWNRGAPTATSEVSGIWSRGPAVTTTMAINSPPIHHSGLAV